MLLVATLAVTPVRRATGWNEIIKLRRMLGLFAFFYATLHLLTWIVLDKFFDFAWMLEDIAERRFITIGMLTWVLLLPLALTSTKGMIRRLGRRWQTLHRLSYVAGRHRRRALLVAGQGRSLRAADVVGACVERAARVPRMVDVANADAVAVLTRAPSSGGKSRLFAALGRPPDPGPARRAAARHDRRRDDARRSRRRRGHARGRLRGSGAVDRRTCRRTPPMRAMRDMHVVGQPDGDLGDRMRGTMARLLDAGARAVASSARTCLQLRANPCAPPSICWLSDRDLLVLGPALDGGYYLIAATRVPRVFETIVWGSARRARADLLRGRSSRDARPLRRACR